MEKEGTLDRLMDLLRGDLRAAEGRDRQASAAIIDTRSVRTTAKRRPGATTPARGSTTASGTSWWGRSA
jgi:hypothetical protein